MLAADPSSPRRARLFISTTLHDWGCDEVEAVAALLVSEIVTNAVRRSTALLSVRYEEGRLDVRVHDESDSLPTLQHTDPEGEAGRGLMLVNALADQWGVEPLRDGGKSVYFRLAC
jgi:anti-sigma regulatory factor (Ser/Thr protein kinase)